MQNTHAQTPVFILKRSNHIKLVSHQRGIFANCHWHLGCSSIPIDWLIHQLYVSLIAVNDQRMVLELVVRLRVQNWPFYVLTCDMILASDVFKQHNRVLDCERKMLRARKQAVPANF